jgi:hypothetical protein
MDERVLNRPVHLHAADTGVAWSVDPYEQPAPLGSPVEEMFNMTAPDENLPEHDGQDQDLWSLPPRRRHRSHNRDRFVPPQLTSEEREALLARGICPEDGLPIAIFCREYHLRLARGEEVLFSWEYHLRLARGEEVEGEGEGEGEGERQGSEVGGFWGFTDEGGDLWGEDAGERVLEIDGDEGEDAEIFVVEVDAEPSPDGHAGGDEADQPLDR